MHPIIGKTQLSPNVTRLVIEAPRIALIRRPGQFVIVRDRETLKQLAGTGTYAGHLAGAAFAVALVTPNESIYDLGQATAFMMLEAWAQGIGSCIATIYEPDQARAILGVPAGQRLPHAISFGYPAAPDAAQAPPKQGGRLPFEEVVRWEHW